MPEENMLMECEL